MLHEHHTNGSTLQGQAFLGKNIGPDPDYSHPDAPSDSEPFGSCCEVIEAFSQDNSVSLAPLEEFAVLIILHIRLVYRSDQPYQLWWKFVVAEITPDLPPQEMMQNQSSAKVVIVIV